MHMGTQHGPEGGRIVLGGASQEGQPRASLYSCPVTALAQGLDRHQSWQGEGMVSLCRGIAICERKDESPGALARIQPERHVTAVQPRASVLTSLNLLACRAGSSEVIGGSSALTILGASESCPQMSSCHCAAQCP